MDYIRRNRGGDVGISLGGYHASIRGGEVMATGCTVPEQIAVEALARRLLDKLGSDPYQWELTRIPGGRKQEFHIPR